MEDKKILYGLIAAIVILFGTTATSGYLFYHSSQKLDEANTVISARVDEIQEFDRKLGIAESDLRRQKDLEKKYKSELAAFDGKFKKMQRDYKLKIQSRDETIAGLRGKVKGGNSTVTVGGPDNGTSGEFTTIIEVGREVCDNQKIAYQWEDDLKRFKLQDPDIFEKDNEDFQYKQHFEIKGHVFADDSGNIQVKKVELQEVYPVTSEEENTEYLPVDNSNISLVSSKFEYTNKIQNEKHLFDIVTLRPIATFDTAATPGLGLELINLGRYIDYVNLGLYGKLAFDVSDPLGGSLQNSRLGLGVSYHLVPPLLDTNFAIGTSVGTPINNLGQWVFTVDVILYLTDDLNPFEWLK